MSAPQPLDELDQPAQPAPALPVLIPQPHGGAILTGGVPGHRGAGGRPPKAIRARARELLARVIEKLEAKLEDERLGVTGLSEAARTLKLVAGEDDSDVPTGITAVVGVPPEQMRALAEDAEERARDADASEDAGAQAGADAGPAAEEKGLRGPR